MLLVLSASCPRAPACGRHLRVPKPAARCRVVRGPAAGRVQASAAGSDGGSEGEAATAHNTGQDTKAAATAKSIDRLLGLDQMESQTPAAAQEPPTVVKPAQPLAARRDSAAAAERRDELARQALTLMAAVGAASLVFSAVWDFGVWQGMHIDELTGGSCVAQDGAVECSFLLDEQQAWDAESRRQP